MHCCRATLKSKDKELDGEKGKVEQHEKHDAEAAHERELLTKQHVRAEDSAHKQAGHHCCATPLLCWLSPARCLQTDNA